MPQGAFGFLLEAVIDRDLEAEEVIELYEKNLQQNLSLEVWLATECQTTNLRRNLLQDLNILL